MAFFYQGVIMTLELTRKEEKVLTVTELSISLFFNVFQLKWVDFLSRHNRYLS